MNLLVRLQGYQSFIRNQLPFIDSLAELKVGLVLLDRTIGFGHTDRALSLQELGRYSGLSEKAVRSALRKLEAGDCLNRQERSGRSAVLGLRSAGEETVVEGSGSPREWNRPRGKREERGKRGTRENHREVDGPETPSLEGDPPPPSEGGGSCNKVSKGTSEKGITSEAQEDFPGKGSLEELAQKVCHELQGKTRRRLQPEEIIPSLRELKAESLNRGVPVDLDRVVLEAVEYGVEANLRKNGANTIWSWKYFLPGLQDAADRAMRETESREERKGQERAQVERVLEEEREREEHVDRLRRRWEDLEMGERAVLEAEVYHGLEGFVRVSVDRDRKAGRRGPGIIALEQACFRALEIRDGGERPAGGVRRVQVDLDEGLAETLPG